jgi:uncharacterized protein YjbI with pentapeptide repeats
LWSSKSVLKQEGGKKQDRWGLRGKTLWDWLPILGTLLIPVFIAAAGWGVAWHLSNLERQRADNAEALEEQRAQDEALQVYLDQMSQLMIENNLRESKEDSAIRVLARARTLTALERLGPLRKTLLIRFLYESDLISREHRVIGLEEADLTETDFTEIDPDEPRLSSVSLEGADFDEANMTGSSFIGAEPRGVHMLGTHLEEAKMRNAYLQEADLTGAFLGTTKSTYRAGDTFEALGAADLRGVNLTDAILRDAFMHEVKMGAYKWGPPTSRYPEKYRELDRTELVNTDLRDAWLWEADLSGAVLDNADFTNAELRNADLSGAGLTGPQHSVNFTGAKLDFTDFTGALLNSANFTDVSGVVTRSANANFTGASLEDADFTNATLDGADFTDAKGITAQQLANQAKSLESATMPNGQKYEDWRTDQ